MLDADRIAQLRKLLRDDPNDELANFSLGSALLNMGQPQEAARHLQKVLALNGRSSKAHQLLGQAQEAIGETSLAIETLTNGYRVAHRQGDIVPMKIMEKSLRRLGADVPAVADRPAAGRVGDEATAVGGAVGEATAVDGVVVEAAATDGASSEGAAIKATAAEGVVRNGDAAGEAGAGLPLAQLDASGFRCRRCGRPGPRLKARPFKGDLGERVLENTCQACWQEWVRMGTRVINELRLPLHEPKAQELYDRHMKEFLLLD